MSLPQALQRLREILQELYPTEPSSRRVVDDTGIPSASISFHSSASNNWHNILNEAHKRGKVLALVDVAFRDYDREDLRDVAQAYRAALAQSEAQPMPQSSTSIPAAATAPDVATCDLAIVTALREELEPVLKLIGGRSQWEQFTLDGFLHYTAAFPCGPRPLRVVASSLSKYGGTAAAVQVQRLKDLHPRLIVMTGICAGRKDKGIRLGDVIVADRAFHVKEGGKQTQAGFIADIRTYNTKSQLLQWLKNFANDPNWHTTITTPRPSSLEYQAEWLLCQLATQGAGFPATPADWEVLKTNHIDLQLARQRLRGMKLLSSTGKLTALARKRIDELRDKNYGQILPTPDPAWPKVYINAFASNDAVVAIDRPFDEAAGHLRSVGAIEMEVPALYDAAEQLGVWAFAVKGVSDYATPEKDDAFHKYAAEASARWMYAFICSHAALLDQVLPGRVEINKIYRQLGEASISTGTAGTSTSSTAGTAGQPGAHDRSNAVSSSSSRSRRCADLATSIDETLQLIKQYDDQRRLADDPRAQARAERSIADLRTQLDAYEREQRELGCDG